MLMCCMCCGEVSYDDEDELLDFFEDEDVPEIYVCEDCFIDFFGIEPFMFDFSGGDVLYYSENDLQDFMDNWRGEIA